MAKWDTGNLCAAHTQREMDELPGRVDDGDLISREAAWACIRSVICSQDWTDCDGDVFCDTIEAALRALPSSQPTVEVERSSLVQNCTIDLRGAGYDCVCRDGNTRFGTYGEGEKVLCEGDHVYLDGLHIFGPTRIAEIEARAEKAEAALAAMTVNSKALAESLAEHAARDEIGARNVRAVLALAAYYKLMEGK